MDKKINIFSNNRFIYYLVVIINMNKDTIVKGLKGAKYHLKNMAQGKETAYEVLSKVKNKATAIISSERPTYPTTLDELSKALEGMEGPSYLGTPEQIMKIIEEKRKDLDYNYHNEQKKIDNLIFKYYSNKFNFPNSLKKKLDTKFSIYNHN